VLFSSIKRFIPFLFIAWASLFSMDIPPAGELNVTKHIMENHLEFKTVGGKVKVRVRLEITFEPDTNIVEVNMLIFDRKKLLTKRELELFW
jgi:hypothetical protein